MDVHVREAQAADAARLVAYVHRLSEEPGINLALSPGEFTLTPEEEARILREYAEAVNSIFLVAVAGDEIAGMLNCQGGERRANRHAVTLSMSVDQDWRNQGVGSLLMERAIAWAKSTGSIVRIELAVFARNGAAIHLYEKYGFEVEGRLRKAMFRDGEYLDNLVMALLL